MLQLNKTLFSTIYEEIHNIENDISFYKAMISHTQKEIIFVHENMPEISSIHLYLRKQKFQEYLEEALNTVSKLRKKILTC